MMNRDKLLKDWMKASPIKIEDCLRVSILLTEMVVSYHERNETIGILTPANIMMRSDLKQAALIGTTRRDPAYLAPEYTGRLNRTPDQRSDLYSLGVISYEMLAGRLPYRQFDSDQDWLTILMTEGPRPLADYRPEVDSTLSAIIMKLLAKSPDARYQTAWGFLADLKLCASHLEQYGTIRSIDVGRFDEMSQFRYPAYLFGRDQAKHQLESAYDRAIQDDAIVTVYVQGEEGVGKTSLIEPFLRDLASKGALVIAGACAHDESKTPYGPILQAVQLGMDQLWSERARDVATMRSLLERELGEELGTLSQLMPESAALLRLPSVPDDARPPDHARTGKALLAIIRCFSLYRKPLVLYVDNLHWADEGTMAIMNRLDQDKSLSGFLCIVSCRTADSADLGTIAPSSLARAEVISLTPLFYDDVRSLVSAMLHEDSMRIRVLARSIYDLTRGNPSILRGLLEGWHRDKKLVFAEHQCRWVWDEELHQLKEDSLNEAFRLYEEGYDRLAPDARELLQIAATIGFKFRSCVLSEVSGYSHPDTIAMLDIAEKEGLVYREDEPEDREQDLVYLFMHARLQSKLLRMQDEVVRTKLHYRIGQAMKSLPDADATEPLFAAADHLNRCIELLTPEEQSELAQLNYRVGWASFDRQKSAKAIAYAESGIRLLEQLNEPFSVIYPYYVLLAHGEYRSGNMEQAHRHMQYLMSHRQLLTQEELITLALYQTEIYAFVNNAEAVRIGRITLSEYGWDLPESVSAWTLLTETVRTQYALRRNRSRIGELAVNDDPAYKQLSQLVITLTVPLLLVDPALLLVLFARYIRFALTKGMNEYTLSIIVSYEFILQRGAPFLHNWLPSGAIEEVEAVPLANLATEYRLPFGIGMYKQLYNPAETMSYLNKAASRSIDRNDATMANLSLITLLFAHFGNIHELARLIAYVEDRALPILDDKTSEVLRIARIYCASMQDERHSAQFIALPDAGDGDSVREDSYTCTSKLEVAYFCEQYEQALLWAQRGKTLEQPFDWMLNRKRRLFEALSGAALYPDAQPLRQKEIAQSIRGLLRAMKQWKGYWGRQSSAYLLIQAEWKRINGRPTREVMRAYEASINQSKEDQYALLEAVALERAFDYYNRFGLLSGYAILLMDACTKYSEWGITVKVNLIRQKHAELLWFHSSDDPKPSSRGDADVPAVKGQAMPKYNPSRHIGHVTDTELLSQLVRWSGVAEAALLEQFLHTAIREAGADRGCILRWDKEDCQVEAHVDSRISAAESFEYSGAISRYVRMTGKQVLLGSASDSHYSRDPYLSRRSPASIICMPIDRLDDGAARLIYLENTQVPSVFAERDVHLLELLIARLSYVSSSGRAASGHRERHLLSEQPPVEKLTEPLTPRETEVLIALSAGYSNKEIASHLGITEATVKTHIFNIYGKLQVKRRGQAIARAKELELI